MRTHVMCLLTAITLLLTGCGVGFKDYRNYGAVTSSEKDDADGDIRLGDDPNAVSIAFSVPVPYQEAYRRADAYGQACRTSKSFARGSWSVKGSLYDDDQTGVVHISASHFGADLERIEIAGTGQSETSVRVFVRNSGTFDQRELDSARQSIETGRPVCR